MPRGRLYVRGSLVWIVPEEVDLPAGDFRVRDMSGGSLAVERDSLDIYEVDPKTAHAWQQALLAERMAALGEISTTLGRAMMAPSRVGADPRRAAKLSEAVDGLRRELDERGPDGLARALAEKLDAPLDDVADDLARAASDALDED